jgi:hypothetical protein
MDGDLMSTGVLASLLRLVTESSAADAADRQVKKSASMSTWRISLPTLPEHYAPKGTSHRFKRGPLPIEWDQHPQREKNILRTENK